MSAATITTSIVSAGTNSHPTTSYEANAFATDFVGSGVVGSIGNTLGASPSTGAFAVNAQASPAMFVDVTAGAAWITATPTGQASQALRAYMSANSTSYAISSNSSGSTKYDWIYLKVNPTAAANPAVDASDVTAIYTSRSSSNTADNNAPPTYGVLLAVVTVANGASSITNSNISDKRAQATPSAQISSTGTGWTALSTPPTSITANGNNSYSIVWNSTDLTGMVSKGMKLKATRTSTAPTECTTLNGSTQYWNRTSSITGITFTDDFVASAWIKLSSYTGSNMTIASRYNGTSGWIFFLDSTGRVFLQGYNASSSNHSEVFSTQSIPLNRWVHVAAQLDMSTFTATTTTSYTMVDGLDVPASVSRAGTNPTALVQAGNLEIGSNNAGGSPFAGELAQVAIYNAKVTQANVRATIGQSLTGSETSLVSAWSFNGAAGDLSVNANSLTAQGSVVATTVDNPFADTTGTTDYAIVMSDSFSTNTTFVVQTPNGYTLPTTGGISAVAYSTADIPYNFPREKENWRIQSIYRNAQTQGSPSGGTWYSFGQLTFPIGSFITGYNMPAATNNSAAGVWSLSSTLSTANNTQSNSYMTGAVVAGNNATSSAAEGSAQFYKEQQQTFASATTLFYNQMVGSGVSNLLLGANNADGILFGDNPYV